MPFKVCRFLSASAHGPAQECGGVAVFSGKGLPLNSAVASRGHAEGASYADAGVGYVSVWAVRKEPARWARFALDAQGIRGGWLQRTAVPAALEPEGSGAAFGPGGMPRFATTLGATIAA